MFLNIISAYSFLWFVLAPTLIFAFIYKAKFYKYSTYVYPALHQLIKNNLSSNFYIRKVLFLLRFLSLIILAFLITRPQKVNYENVTHVDGIDIVLALDVSGSMQLFDDLADQRTRIEVAKSEAIKFVNNRPNDPIAIVIFANDIVSRCPLTLDKSLLEKMISDLNLGIINPEGTMLSKGLLMAVNRLKKSESKSKIIILLTDGEPTPGDIDPMLAISLAKEYGIKIYTIGIGADSGGYFKDPMFGIRQVEMSLNRGLLEKIANQTGGKFFESKKPEDLNKIYNIINSLEKSDKETLIFNQYQDFFMPFLIAAIIILCGSIFLQTFIWFSI